MIRNDYILKMIEQLSRVLASLIMNKKKLNQAEIEEQYNALSLRYTGLDYDFLIKSDVENLLDLYSIGGELDYTKCFATAHLLFEDFKTGIYSEKKADLEKKPFKALTLYLECVLFVDDDLVLMLGRNIELLVQKTGERLKSVHELEKMILLYERLGRYDKAENYLFELAGRQVRAGLRIGGEFYNRLLKKPDEELARGNLPRQEINEGMKTLTAMNENGN